MPFKACMSLISTELAFRKHLRAIAQNQEHHILSLPEFIILQRKKNTQTPDEIKSEILIDFYQLVLDLINHSVVIKHRYLNKLPDQTQNDFINIDKAQRQIISFVEKLEKQHPDLWDYLLDQNTGRHTLYYLIFTNLVHGNAWHLEQTLTQWISALLNHCSDQDEQHVLEYLAQLLKNDTPISDEHSNNPFIHAHTIINLKAQTESFDFKISELHKLIEHPIKYGVHTPNFIKNFIQIQLSHSAFMQVGNYIEENTECLNIIQALSKAQYLIKIPESIQGETSAHLLSQTCHLYEHIHIFSFYYSLYIDHNIVFNAWHGTLMHLHVYLYGTMQECSITAEHSLSLAFCAINLIRKNLVKIESDYPEHIQVFWQSIAKIFLPNIEMKQEFICFFATHLNIIIDNLYRQGMELSCINILSRYLDYPREKTNHSASVQKQYRDIFNIIFFIYALEKKEKTSDEAHVQNLLNLIQQKHEILREGLLLAFLKSFQSISSTLKSNLVKRIQSIKAVINITDLHDKNNQTRYQIQKYLFELALLLGSDKEEINQLELELGYDDYLSFQLTNILKDESSTSNSSSPKKKLSLETKTAIKQTESPSVSSMSLFKPRIEHSISRNRLPKALLELADLIKKITNQDLIITGGAVTSLFLERGKPHDFDCLILDVDKQELLAHLKKAGISNCQLIGKHFPIIKLKLLEEKEQLEVDISTDRSEGLPLNKAMEGILAKRDFKLSALYMSLSTGQDFFEIKGCDRSIRSINQQRISVVNQRDNIFQEDPIRLLRLTKILLQYPDFSIDDKLALILRQSNLKAYFHDFLTQQKTALSNQGRLGTALENLFARFDQIEVIRKMGELGIIEGMTGLHYEQLKASLDIFSAYKNSSPYFKKVIFYQFIYIHHCLTLDHPKDLLNWPFYKVARHLQAEHRIYYDFIEQQILKTEIQVFVNAAHILELIDRIKNKQTQNVTAAKAGSPLLSVMPAKAGIHPSS